MIRTLLCLTVLSTSTLAAQQSPFVGTWSVSYPAGAMLENGIMTPIMATGVLSIIRSADSLVGELVMDPNPELGPRPMVRMAAAAGAGEVTFVSYSEATLTMNGSESKTTVISSWKLAVQGDTLSGTVERRLEGFEEANQPPHEVTGVRQQGPTR
jgi:hypothetical protein